MDEKEYNEIREISFPNTVADNEKSFYTNKKHYFSLIMEAGEMYGIPWIGIFDKDTNRKVAQIKQSVCDIYFN